MRILYVEDNPANLFLVKRVAKMGGHDVINYIDGEEALRNYAGDAPDLVLMDIELSGGLNGLEVVRELRHRGYKTPIVAVTAYAMVGDRERCIDAGCDEYIAKPIPIPQLISVLERFEVPAPIKTTEETSTRTTDKMSRPPLDQILEETAHSNQETEMMPVSPLQNLSPLTDTETAHEGTDSSTLDKTDEKAQSPAERSTAEDTVSESAAAKDATEGAAAEGATEGAAAESSTSPAYKASQNGTKSHNATS